MKSSGFKSADVFVIDIAAEDLGLPQTAFALLELAEQSGCRKVAINLQALPVIQSGDIAMVEQVVNGLLLSGIESVVCGFNPESAAIVVHFVEHFRFRTALDVQRAVDELSCQ